MGAKLRSGFYLGRRSAALLALLLAALLLALLALGVLYGRCAHELEGAGGAGPSTPCANASPSAGPPARPPGPWDHWRLPAALAPLHYALLLWPHLAPGLPEPRTHSGRVRITVRCREATAAVLLHSARLTYQSAAVWGPGANGSGSRRRIPVAELWDAPSNQYVVLELREKLSAGALYELQLAFRGSVNAAPHFNGLFLNSYRDEGENRWLIASKLEPTAARSVYPCFDEPAMKATFNISIVHHPSYVALSNMPAIDVSEYKDENENTLSGLTNGTTPMNWTVTTYETTPKMSTYITAFVVCNFDYVTTTERGKEIRIWAKKDAVRKGFVNYALNITGPIFSFVEDLLNISYTLSKSDLIALPGTGGVSMENWGLITFQENYLLYSPEDKFAVKKTEIRQVVSHEIVHQWFGNLATMAWWNNLWLNEGFASYFGHLGAHHIESTLSPDQDFSSNVMLPILTWEGRAPQSLSHTNEDHRAISELFDLVTYNKSYLNAFSFSNAVQDDLWNHIQKVIDEQNDLQLPAPVKVIMDSWTCQKGFPLLNVNFSTGNISQETFYTAKGINDTNKKWMVPISWIKNGVTQPLVWLDKSSKIFPEMKISDSEQDWIILNVNMTGYYRINYDQMYWRRLAKMLESDPKVIPVVNRLYLMADAFQLKQFNYTEYGTPLYLTKYLEKEDNILVWTEALRHLEVDNWEFILSDYELYPVLKEYFLPRILPIYHHYAYLLRQSLDMLGDSYATRFGIGGIIKIACWFGLRDCLDLSSEMFSKWMNNPSLEAPFYISSTIRCYGVRLGGEKEWDFAWKMFKQNDTKEKDSIFSALSCTREPWLLQRFLQYILNNTVISSSLVTTAIRDVARNEIGHRIAWKFVTENWSHLYNRSGFQALTAFVSPSSTDLEVQMIQAFLNNTLEPELRSIPTDELLSEKSENEERKRSVTKMIMWLKKNMDG